MMRRGKFLVRRDQESSEQKAWAAIDEIRKETNTAKILVHMNRSSEFSDTIMIDTHRQQELSVGIL